MVSSTRRLAGNAATPVASGAVRALVLYSARNGGRKAANSTGLRSSAVMMHCSMPTRALLEVANLTSSSGPAGQRFLFILIFIIIIVIIIVIIEYCYCYFYCCYYYIIVIVVVIIIIITIIIITVIIITVIIVRSEKMCLRWVALLCS